MKKHILFITTIFTCCIAAANTPRDERAVQILVSAHPAPRVQFGVDRLSAALERNGYTVTLAHSRQFGNSNYIAVGDCNDSLVQFIFGAMNWHPTWPRAREGFLLVHRFSKTAIAGTDYSGVLYGCLELARRIDSAHALPAEIIMADQPEMVLRGACIGLQKSTYLPGRNVYEYPYTPETFPWFYDKTLWIQYLDQMVANRMNSLYLWNGHPFASLVKLPDYPYAVEVDDATFKKNEDIFRFLTQEADKRGIWVIQLFYNIIVSKPFAEHNHIKTQDRNRPIIPLIADYTRKSIAAFVQKYPNVGLMVTLGEAMEGVGNDDIEWFTKTIIPGVKDGLRALGQTTQPPIVLRAHDTDAPAVMKAALPLYHNLYTEAKYNGEALTTYDPHGSWAELHRKLSSLGTVQIENVHIMANLEPFRYGAVNFIQQCVLAMHNIYGANGLHLYPQASYWDWPYSADNSSPRLLQVNRDWIWYAAWARYAWNCHRDAKEEAKYWTSQLAAKYGCSPQDAACILEAYEQSGEIAPKLLRRYGITDGNRQTLTLGMLMTQLINPTRFGLFTLLYESEGPPGEMLTQYAEKEWKNQPHTGETPVQAASEVVAHGRQALDAISKVKTVTKNLEEFKRLANDISCYNALANTYAQKALAALSVLRYNYSNDLRDLQTALPLLQNSLTWYHRLQQLTATTYLYANSMQTQQRKIPVRGVDGSFKTWTDMLPVYEKELTNFKKNLDSLKKLIVDSSKWIDLHPGPHKVLQLNNATVSLLSKAEGYYTLTKGQPVFLDTTVAIEAVAPELQGLNAIQFSRTQQQAEGTVLTFSANKPVKILVGFFAINHQLTTINYLKEPELETDASANDYGQAETKMAHALLLPGLPPVNVHSYSFAAGGHTLTLGKGICLILGVVDDTDPIHIYDARLNEPGKKDIDWLFDN